jgi:hypothetical protein
VCVCVCKQIPNSMTVLTDMLPLSLIMAQKGLRGILRVCVRERREGRRDGGTERESERERERERVYSVPLSLSLTHTSCKHLNLLQACKSRH